MSKISILITGASTGIGRAIAVSLAADGHQVFASVRKVRDAQSLQVENSEIIPLLFDVTDGEAIKLAVPQVRERLVRGQAFSLINNAGVAVPGPLEELPMADFRRQFDSNVFGLLDVTQNFLPLVRENKGRIVNMSSVSGLLASPFLGAYAASKFAVEAMSDALRLELRAEGIKVLLLEPGPILTPIWEKNFSAPRPNISERYVKPLERWAEMVKKVSDKGLPAEHVVRAARRALFDNSPPERQVVTRLPGHLQLALGKRLPARWLDRLIMSQLLGK